MGAVQITPAPPNTKQDKTRQVRVLLHLGVGDLCFTQPDLSCPTTPKDGAMKFKTLIVALTLSLTSGCAYYNDRTADTSKNGRIACDAEPANQPGCYTKQSKDWNWGGLKFEVGASN
jgi:hypothetical protein